MELKIKEVAKLTGVTVRTLHYYDEIGLLHPSHITDVGYRLYDDEALARLQQILFFKELEFPLSQIKEIMANPHFDTTDALLHHKALLIKKRDRLSNLIDLVNTTLEGEHEMNFDAFDMTEIEKCKEQYAEEAAKRWGDSDAYKESVAKTASYGKKEWNQVNELANEIMKAFADNMDKEPSDPVVQSLVKQWQNHITKNFYRCTNEILAGLGLMYVGDERFTKNIDTHKEGLAQFISDAIAVYCTE